MLLYDNHLFLLLKTVNYNAVAIIWNKITTIFK